MRVDRHEGSVMKREVRFSNGVGTSLCRRFTKPIQDLLLTASRLFLPRIWRKAWLSLVARPLTPSRQH